MSHQPDREPVNAQKLRTGASRMWHAFGYSCAGLRSGWGETAFRQEAVAAVVLIPAAFWIGRNWVEVSLLCAVWLPRVLAPRRAREREIDPVGAAKRQARERRNGRIGALAGLLLGTAGLVLGLWLSGRMG
mgnify:CR=1 FL=1